MDSSINQLNENVVDEKSGNYISPRGFWPYWSPQMLSKFHSFLIWFVTSLPKVSFFPNNAWCPYILTKTTTPWIPFYERLIIKKCWYLITLSTLNNRLSQMLRSPLDLPVARITTNSKSIDPNIPPHQCYQIVSSMFLVNWYRSLVLVLETSHPGYFVDFCDNH